MSGEPLRISGLMTVTRCVSLPPFRIACGTTDASGLFRAKRRIGIHTHHSLGRRTGTAITFIHTNRIIQNLGPRDQCSFRREDFRRARIKSDDPALQSASHRVLLNPIPGPKITIGQRILFCRPLSAIPSPVNRVSRDVGEVPISVRVRWWYGQVSHDEVNSRLVRVGGSVFGAVADPNYTSVGKIAQRVSGVA